MHKRKEANAIWGTACQNAAYLAAICDLKLRFRATTGGRGAISEIALLKRCDFAFAFGRPLGARLVHISGKSQHRAAKKGAHQSRFRPQRIANQAHGQVKSADPKCFGEGAKRSLRKRGQKACCTGATWGCTGANLVCTGASDFWETLSPSGQKTFCTPARQLSVICAKLTPVHGALVCNQRRKKRRKRGGLLRWSPFGHQSGNSSVAGLTSTIQS